ncbi:hypothetical protein BDV98DRAFT_507850 [Pterulicium gracile]|uniref:Uncharacterized protein n=1 Tax=Pterulicium gracile TaxID=1884261 RepID=A0A5C3QI66_9AGAR|nr:hypothetical protein BDV98DRAFT_507850 [Pterula gracilis]
MCGLQPEPSSLSRDGTRWARCGHFQRHMINAIVDCSSSRCTKSLRHPRTCQDPHCIQIFGDEIQNDIDTVDEYCWACRSALERAARQQAQGR